MRSLAGEVGGAEVLGTPLQTWSATAAAAGLLGEGFAYWPQPF
jgi:hypothetical protein